MKKILFIMETFPLGGISKSLLSLWSMLGNEYEIDFVLFSQEGFFINSIPDSITLLPVPIEAPFRNPHPRNVFNAYKELNMTRFVRWVIYSLKCCIVRLFRGQDLMVCSMDITIAKLARPIQKHYDAAIAYQGARCIYYLAEKIDADVRIGYVHSDYSNNHTDYMMKAADKRYFPLMDHICTITPTCCESLKKEFPNIKEKFCVVENICSPRMINDLAQKGKGFDDDWDGFRVCTMGRIDIEIKGLDIAVEACRLLIDKGIRLRWYFLGDGAQRPILERMIINAGVEESFILLGAQENPYSFIANADLYVHPSRIEGKSVALDEVKSLHKPVVVTDFSTVYDQFENEKTALIAHMTPQSVAEKIEQLIIDTDLRESIISNLKNEKIGNEEQVIIFKKLIDNNDC